MTHLLPLTPLPDEWEATRATLHLYANAVGVIPRAHAVPNDRWWHISLKVRPTGLTTDTMPLPGGGTFQLRMDLRNHEVVLETSSGVRHALSMAAGLTGAEFGDQLVELVAKLGVEGDYAREKYANDEARVYDPAAAAAFFSVLVNIDHNLELHRSALEGPVGPLQIWPHGFDLAFEWFGTRTEKYEEHGETKETPAQLNLGFYPEGRAYFYSNPWPFDLSLTEQALPGPAAWHTEGWEGSILYYDELLAAESPGELLLDYARAVFAAAAPTLSAG
ncbi:MAG: DUF5996 family protein [Acidimicrobiia bacterium]|nr:DUF5996 family protein [Acidimicrobiia bacterium]